MKCQCGAELLPTYDPTTGRDRLFCVRCRRYTDPAIDELRRAMGMDEPETEPDIERLRREI